ncbi:MAG: XdhC family protein [Deltaproteobacteria bacterium]|nr:XdhC family protein [Deltaproteobacteria bacterium]
MPHEPDPPPARSAPPEEVLGAALERLRAGRRVMLATVVATRGSAPSRPGQKLALLGPGEALGTVGGGALEHKVLAMLAERQQAEPGEPELVGIELGPELGMCCGGAVEILLEPLGPALAVLIVGGGHVGAALGPLLCQLDFRVVVCDSRPAVLGGASGAPSPRLRAVVADHDDPAVMSALGAPETRAAALVMTHDHDLDERAIQWALARGFAFVGGVGSRAKAARIRQRLVARGLAQEQAARVRMPLGVDVGARAPLEVAVAIAAELVGWRAGLLGAARGRAGASKAP